MFWCPYETCGRPMRGGFLQCVFCRRPFDYSDTVVVAPEPAAPAAGEDPVLAQKWRERAERAAADAMETLREVNLTARKNVQEKTGVDYAEREERKRQKLFQYGVTGTRSAAGKDRQTMKRVIKHIKQWDGCLGYRIKASKLGWTRFDKFECCPSWVAEEWDSVPPPRYPDARPCNITWDVPRSEPYTLEEFRVMRLRRGGLGEEHWMTGADEVEDEEAAGPARQGPAQQPPAAKRTRTHSPGVGGGSASASSGGVGPARTGGASSSGATTPPWRRDQPTRGGLASTKGGKGDEGDVSPTEVPLIQGAQRLWGRNLEKLNLARTPDTQVVGFLPQPELRTPVGGGSASAGSAGGGPAPSSGTAALWAGYRPTTSRESFEQARAHGAAAAAAEEPPPSPIEGMTGEHKGYGESKGYGKGYGESKGYGKGYGEGKGSGKTYGPGISKGERGYGAGPGQWGFGGPGILYGQGSALEGKGGYRAPSWYAEQGSAREYRAGSAWSGAGSASAGQPPDTGRGYGSTAYSPSGSTMASTPRAVLTPAARRHPTPPPAPVHDPFEGMTGEPKGKSKGKHPFRPGFEAQAAPEPPKGKGRPSFSSGATKGGGGFAGAWAGAAGWGAKGAKGASMGAEENIAESDWFFTIFCLFMILVGVGLASRPVRSAMARFLRWLARLIEGDGVRAHVVIDFPADAGPVSADARALPTRTETVTAGTPSFDRRPVAFIDPSIPASSPAWAYYQHDARSPSAPSSSGARALPSRRGTEHDETRRWPGMFNFPARPPTYIDYLTKKCRGEVAEKDTQTQLQPFSRPGCLLLLEEMTVYELKTIAKDYGLQTNGVKAILIARIKQFLAPTF